MYGLLLGQGVKSNIWKDSNYKRVDIKVSSFPKLGGTIYEIVQINL